MKQLSLVKLFQYPNNMTMGCIFLTTSAEMRKQHTIVEELIVQTLSEIIRTIVQMPAFSIINNLSLGNRVQKIIDEMTQDDEDSLCISSLYNLSSQLCKNYYLLQIPKLILKENPYFTHLNRFVKKKKNP